MATVTNLTNQALSIAVAKGVVISTFFLTPRMRVKEGSDSEEEIDPASSTEDISDAQIQQWLKKPLNQAMVDQRSITVELSGDEVEVEATEPVKGEHWKTTLKRIGEISDPDELESMYAGETRDKVKKALEERMAQVA